MYFLLLDKKHWIKNRIAAKMDVKEAEECFVACV